MKTAQNDGARMYHRLNHVKQVKAFIENGLSQEEIALLAPGTPVPGAFVDLHSQIMKDLCLNLGMPAWMVLPKEEWLWWALRRYVEQQPPRITHCR